MVIVVMGEVESGSSRVGRLLAESLGWEFADIESLDCATHKRSPLTDSELTPQIAALSAVIDSSTCAWRDLVISCPTLTDKEQRRLRHNRPLVKLVLLRRPDNRDHSFRPDPSEFTNSGLSVGGSAEDESVLAMDGSQRVEQILDAVLSALILKQRSPNVHAA